MDDLMQHKLEVRKQTRLEQSRKDFERIFRATFLLPPGEIVHSPHIHPECFLVRGYYMRRTDHMALRVYVPKRVFSKERWVPVANLDELAELEARHPDIYVCD